MEVDDETRAVTARGDTSIGHDIEFKYSSSKRRGRVALKETGILFLDLLKTTESGFIDEETQNVVDALLDRNNVDVFYLELLAMLSPSALTDIIIQLCKKYSKPQDFEIRTPLLCSLAEIVPNCVDNEHITELMMATARLLLNEASRRNSVYCSEYRQAAVMRLTPLLLSRKKKTPRIKKFFSDVLPDTVKFLMAAALQGTSDSDAVCLTQEEIWQSAMELLNEMYYLHVAEDASPPGPKKKSSLVNWNIRKPSLLDLTVWWNHFMKPQPDGLWRDPSSRELNFFCRFTFWSFLLCWYYDLKSESEIPERIPFLMNLSQTAAMMPESSSSPNARQFLGAKLERLFLLTVEVGRSLSNPEDEHDDNLFSVTTKELHLEDSIVYLTFRSDLAVATGITLSASLDELHPAWLKIQLAVSYLNSTLWNNPLLIPAVFVKIADIFSLLYRTSYSPVPGKKASISTDNHLMYVWSDTEIIEYFCGVIVNHLVKLPLDRATDDFLSAVLVFIQPVLRVQASAVILRNVITVISGRDKYSFKKFFMYVVSPDVISEMAQLISTGTGMVELTLEPMAGASVSVHKTRGANRGSTDAILLELQRHVTNVSAGCSSYQAVLQFVKNEREELIRTIFHQTGVHSARRSRTSSAV